VGHSPSAEDKHRTRVALSAAEESYGLKQYLGKRCRMGGNRQAVVYSGADVSSFRCID